MSNLWFKCSKEYPPLVDTRGVSLIEQPMVVPRVFAHPEGGRIFALRDARTKGARQSMCNCHPRLLLESLTATSLPYV
jgi:hypothetical protein